MNITFRQLKLFLALADTGSVTAAARMRHITQPTASLQLREISNTVGLPLFEVISKKVHLTELGKKLALSANTINDEWEAFEQHVFQLKGFTVGTLKISVVSTAKYFIPRLLGNFCTKYPSVDIALEVLNRDAVIARLENNMDDIYIMTKPPSHLEIDDEIFMDNPLVCIASSEHPLANRKIELKNLQEEYFVMREIGSGTRMSCDIFFKDRKFQPKIRLSLGSNEAIKQAVASGLGLSVVSVHSINPYDSKEGISVLNLPDFPIKSQWHIVTLKGKKLSPIATIFHDHLLSEAKKISAGQA